MLKATHYTIFTTMVATQEDKRTEAKKFAGQMLLPGCIQNTESSFLRLSRALHIFHDSPKLFNRVVIKQFRFSNRFTKCG